MILISHCLMDIFKSLQLLIFDTNSYSKHIEQFRLLLRIFA